jgi:hypothetical protein
MGWHYILTFTCKLLPEYKDFIEKEYLRRLFDENLDVEYRYTPIRKYYSFDEFDEAIEERKMIADWEQENEKEDQEREAEYNTLSKFYKDLIDIWNRLCIGTHFYEYDLKDNIFTCKISKKVNKHSGDLREDYETFLEDIIVPITSEITSCDIESDDYGDMRWYYTDSQLRNIHFNLKDKIKDVIHTYDDDGGITETRIIYKHTIKPIQLIDLNRSFGKKD